MSDRTNSRPRLVNARRVSTLTGIVALTAAGVLASAEAHAEGEGETSAVVIQTEGEGEAEHMSAAEAEGEGEAHASEGEGESEGHASEGEGEGAAHAAEGEGEAEGGGSADDDVALLTGLGFMEGHIRAGLALYEEGDLAAAKTHMGHPIEEKYEAVEEQLEEAGHGVLEEQIKALAAATENEADLTEVEALFAEVRETMQAVRADHTADQQVAGLIALTRIAGEEYTAAVGDGQSVTDLHEYQDSWGFLRVVEVEATQMAESDDAVVADVARSLLEQVEMTDAVYGDLQGEGSFDADPSVIYGAAARMELAGLTLESGEGEGEAGHEGEGEGEGESDAGHEGEGEASHEGEGESDASHEGEGESD